MFNQLGQITTVFCDVDGVLTDGSLPYTAEGQHAKSFHAQDGAMIKLAQAQGISVGILSGRSSAAVAQRAQELGINHCLLGVGDKVAALEDWLSTQQSTVDNIAYIADDLPDLGICSTVAWSVAVADASPLLRRRCDYVCRRAGGRAAVAEALAFLLQAQGKLQLSDQGHG